MEPKLKRAKTKASSQSNSSAVGNSGSVIKDDDKEDVVSTDNSQPIAQKTCNPLSEVVNPQQQHQQQQQQQQILSEEKKNEIIHKDVQDILETDLSCAICQDIYINPLILNCSHSFCKFCVYRWLSKKTGCPQCRMTVSFQAENLALRNIINKMVQKSSPQFQTTRTTNVSQRLKDEEEQEKDGTTRALMKAATNNIDRSRRRRRRNEDPARSDAYYVPSIFSGPPMVTPFNNDLINNYSSDSSFASDLFRESDRFDLRWGLELADYDDEDDTDYEGEVDDNDFDEDDDDDNDDNDDDDDYDITLLDMTTDDSSNSSTESDPEMDDDDMDDPEDDDDVNFRDLSSDSSNSSSESEPEVDEDELEDDDDDEDDEDFSDPDVTFGNLSSDSSDSSSESDTELDDDDNDDDDDDEDFSDPDVTFRDLSSDSSNSSSSDEEFYVYRSK